MWVDFATGRPALAHRARLAPAPKIDVGGSRSSSSYGNGAAWTGDYRDGRVTRVDGRTNTVTETTTVAAAQSLAAGGGSVWVSVAGGTREGTLPAAMCAAMESGGAKPDVLIASNLPLRGTEADITRAEGGRDPLGAQGSRLPRGPLRRRLPVVRRLDGPDRSYENRRCAANANAFARAERDRGRDRSYHSFCAMLEIPILNRAPGGAVALVSPSTTAPELTRGPPDSSTRPAYATTSRDRRGDVAGVAHALLARDLRALARLPARCDQTDSRARITVPFRRAAARLRTSGSPDRTGSTSSPKAYAALAERVARSRADGVVIDGSVGSGGGALIKALRARLGVRGSRSWSATSSTSAICSTGGERGARRLPRHDRVLSRRESLTARATRFVTGFGSAARRGTAMNAAQAAEVVLDGDRTLEWTRAGVLRALRSRRVKDGILGSFAFDRNGDINPASVTILRVTGAMSRDSFLTTSREPSSSV